MRAAKGNNFGMGSLAAIAFLCVSGSDFSRSPIHSGQAAGLLLGKPFRAPVTELHELGYDTYKEGGKLLDRARKFHLELKSNNDLFPERSITVIFTTDADQKLPGTTLKQPFLQLHTDAHRRHYYPRPDVRVGRGILSVHMGGNGIQTQMFSESISGRVEFTTATGGTVEGRLILALPNPKENYVTGTFRARHIVLTPGKTTRVRMNSD